MKTVIKLLTVLLVCGASTCRKENCHPDITFVNRSSKDVNFIRGSDDCNGTGFSMHECFNAVHTIKVKAGESGIQLGRRSRCIESMFTNGRSFLVYVFDAKEIDTLPWKDVWPIDTIRPTLEELRNSNWTVTYTGE